MSFNNGYERKKFNNEQALLPEKYRAYGMSEQAIKEMYEFDYEWFKSQRRYAMNTCNGGKQLYMLLAQKQWKAVCPYWIG